MAEKNNKGQAPTQDELLAIIKKQGEQLAALEAKVNPPAPEAAEKPETPKQVFAVDGAKFRFNVPSYINADGNVTLAKDALKNPAELERLVTIKSGILTAVK